MDKQKKTYGDDEIHADESDYLFIAKSEIANAGQGLFTLIDIYKDEIIAIYHGEKLNSAEAARRTLENQHHYFINLPEGGVLDCGRTDGFAKYANDAEGEIKGKLRNNAKIALDEHGTICLVALRRIKSMQEIYCGYGKRYWQLPRDMERQMK